MIKSILNLFIVLTSLTTYGQDITGQWNGILKAQGTQLRVVFNILKSDKGYSSTMDSPDQGAKGIPVTLTSYVDSVLKIEVTSLKIEYQGKLDKENNIIGDFKQRGQPFPMNLSKKIIEIEKVIRPQEPTKPYPYYSEDVKFKNKKNSITLSGTLTLPRQEGCFPVVVLITGSGPQNRDEEIFGHKPFLVLADHLTRNGIAVLRYDDRGTSQSSGNFKISTTLDFASDVEAAIKYLKTRKEINKKKMGLIGHSEGGIIAPIVAVKCKEISFIVLLAGTGITGGELLLLQQELIGKVSGMSDTDLQKAKINNKGVFDIISKSTNQVTLKTDLAKYIKQTLKDYPESNPSGIIEDDFIKLQISKLTTPWMQYFIKYNPSIVLEKVKCPVLALNGEKDLQVRPKVNLEAIKISLEKGGNKNVTTKELPNLNHLFQECETGSINEYSKIEQTFSPKALTEISNWILIQVK